MDENEQRLKDDADYQREIDEITNLETVLSVHQLFLLFQIEAGDDGCGMHEPIWPLITKDPLPPITIAPGLTEQALTEMAQARALERLGLLSAHPTEPLWELTPKGRAVVTWWCDALKDWMPERPAEPSPD